ncbi:MAG: DUF4105 domain-containing protein [Gemmatimonadaceae bacterium]
MPHVECPELAAYERRLSATSLSVVFVSSYLNNPASAFGHTMLYLGSGSERSATLSDYSVSFEADIRGMSAAEYMRRGLFGGLIAEFRVEPLYLRVRRYEREEQRDLWLFPLKLKQEDINQFVRHLWELKGITFQYGFLRGNCAQKILAVVHAVAPAYEVLPYRRAAVLPAEVSRRLVEQIGTAASPTRRPSLWSQYSRQVARLSPEERRQLEAMEASRTVVDGASPATLSAAMLWSEFETPYRAFGRAAEGGADHGDLAWRRALWASRVAAKDAGTSDSTGSEEESGPSLLESHEPSSITLRGGYRRGTGSVLNVGARWLLHGAVDPPMGYPAVSGLEVAHVEFGVSEAGELVIDEVTALRIEKLAPALGLQSHLAWKFDIGARRLPYDGALPLHVGAEIGVGAGAARVRPTYAMALYSMVGVRPGATIARGGTAFLPSGLWTGGLLLRLPADFRARLSAEYSLSLRSFRGGTGVFNVVARKGLFRDLDLELVATLGAESPGVSVGLVSFR